ncbi:MAG: flagellar biosynthetic protein FliR [Serratia proteamaculans]|jgi:flagellar biosynthetic protein FliR|uniref:Flagellar biosynthetic protein FliR n=1 Tax=Serratia proteamaculans TaxID=28151 RepID=A0ABS0TMN1_SERPR|nr:flagellar biosynthetic protein FliR [Serratia proteamaculans]SPZ55874.1 Flagellar biosynthetic protein fliR [Serratia quinivorans]KAB1499034.1 flagellar type III secretion system protein FliR [Serratia proteamaculans]MBI6179611.1 flagellar type III secretion system protein FliR [Serratia proteamaculans]NWA71749.1 flagellar type III secretion system protein FliR [Serratia proteamaculans]RYM53121.1 flagellar biosynthetic protein FliR [Serratia proteamaculans]
MLTFDSAQFGVWLSQYFWPLLRILALISTAPVFSEKQISKKVKIGLGGLIVILVAPGLPISTVPIFSAAGLWLAAQQILIGVALGLTMQFAFAAIRLAGEVIGMQMGLSFATFFDPSGGPNTPVLARLLNLLAMLLFLSFNGHLWLISLLVDSFHTLPIQAEPLNGNGFLALTQAGSLIFINGMMLALPLICLLLTLNMALGLLNRMTPQLSVFVIGFPVTMTIGIMTIGMMMPMLAPFCEHLFGEFFDRLADVLGNMTP